MITIGNQILQATISPLGAELKSLRANNQEYLWNGTPEIWNSSAPIMFPICGGLKDNTYTFGGKTYSLPKHGYVRNTLFEVESTTSTSAVFLHKSNEQTLAQFPFSYELRVIYTVQDTTLQVRFEVKNLTDGTMYFSIGAHEGYYTPEGIEDYDVIFPEEETLSANVLYGELCSHQLLPIIKESRVLPLYDKYFTVDALVFKQLKSKSATLRNRKTGKAVRVDFPYANYFLLWHKPNAPYICLEPWAGVQDPVDASGRLEEKEGIQVLYKGNTYTADHFITVLA